MDKNKLAIATITWARDPQEERRLRQSLPWLAELKIPTCITDAGSGKGFIEFLQSYAHFTVRQAVRPGLWPQVRQSLEAAQGSERKFLFYTEPDKLEFFRDHLPELIRQAPEDSRLGALIPGRSAEAFSTFPEFQQFTETTINHCCAEIIGSPADYSYGPFFLNAELAPYLYHLPEAAGWGWRIYAFALTRLRNYRIEFRAGNFACPAEQREDRQAERIYRMRQMTEGIQGLIFSTTAFAGKL
jgi:hypothetical protein